MNTLFTFQDGPAVQLLKKRERNKTKMIRIPLPKYKPLAYVRQSLLLQPVQASLWEQVVTGYRTHCKRGQIKHTHKIIASPAPSLLLLTLYCAWYSLQQCS